MKNKLKKLIFAIVVIVGLILIAEKLFIQKDTLEVSQNEAQAIQNQENDNHPKQEENTQDYHVLVIGNSLTVERDGIGMAASDQYHDYYYLTKQRLQKKYSNLTMNRISCIHWEENRIISSRTDWIRDNLPQNLVQNQDLVIFQLGDNCVPTETFEESVTELVGHVKQYSPNAKMLFVGMWFINEERMAMIPQICQKLGMEFVDISDLVVDENKSHIGAEVTTIDGKKNTIATIEEAFHPNDQGMQKIAERICSKLGL